MTDRTDIDLSAVKARLLERLKELNELASTSQDSRKPVELDQTSVGRLSRIDAIQGQAMAIEAERRREIERQRIHTSLERIEAGDYGYCVRCDEQIPRRRLEMDPTTPLCVACATEG